MVTPHSVRKAVVVLGCANDPCVLSDYLIFVHCWPKIQLLELWQQCVVAVLSARLSRNSSEHLSFCMDLKPLFVSDSVSVLIL